ncbi:MAG: trypsin-like serine protease [Xanthobacteraceae bacterium]|nr:trypsin-like serine protease [Xanthobacteraceae bacterium]QYK45805.1 MAG: trypsin-like serine protease [Xanthobacteraceae bacterium]
MLRFLVSIAALAALVLPSRAIVGGGEGTIARPHTVMIISRGGEVCSATAIARDIVITAAHCVARGSGYSISYSGGLIPVSRIVVHPGFRKDSFETRKPSPDLAILKLSSPLPYYIKPVRLAADAKLPTAGTLFYIAGWGLNGEGNHGSVGTLRVAQLPSVGNTGGIMVRLSPGPGGDPRGSCEGDSGGSVYRLEDGELVLHGVIGWALGPRGRMGCGGVTGATLVGIQHRWIRETMRELSPANPAGEKVKATKKKSREPAR